MRKEKVTTIGSVVAASAASACCVGPLVASVVGVGSLGAASALSRWRPLLLGVTFVLLAVGWYWTYRGGQGDGCECKQNATGSRAVLWVGTILAVALAGVPLYGGAVSRLLHPREAGPAQVAGAGVTRVTVRIPGMDCAACAVNIQRALMKQEGIVRAEVIFKTKQAVIEYDAAKTSAEKVIKAVDETGFKAEPITRLEKQ
jgi:mercuric ion binding protein